MLTRLHVFALASIRYCEAEAEAISASTLVRSKARNPTSRRRLRLGSSPGGRTHVQRHASHAGERFGEFDCPVVDGVATTVGIADSLTRIRLNTSKLCAYQQPFAKSFVSASEFTEL